MIVADVDHAGAFDEEIAVAARVDGIAGNRDAVAVGEVDVVLLRPDDVAANGDETGWARGVRLFENADVAASF